MQFAPPSLLAQSPADDCLKLPWTGEGTGHYATSRQALGFPPIGHFTMPPPWLEPRNTAYLSSSCACRAERLIGPDKPKGFVV